MYTRCKTVPEFSRRGQFIADAAGHRLIEANAPRAYALRSAAGRSVMLAALISACRERGYHFESVYDAAKGNVYMAFIFQLSAASDPETRERENMGARRMAWDYIIAPESAYYPASAPC